MQRGLSAWGAPNAADPRPIDGYRRLAALIDEKGASRGSQGGWKIAANDAATQTRLGLAGPVIGALWAPLEHQTTVNVDIDAATLPAVETEIALEIVEDVESAADSMTLARAIGRISVAAEVIDLDQRFDDVASLVGGNFLHRAYAVADTASHVAPGSLANAVLTVSLNDAVAWQVPAGFVLGDPIDMLRCAAANARLMRRVIRARQVLLSGVITPLPVWMRPGDNVRIEGGPLGDLELRFVGAKQ